MVTSGPDPTFLHEKTCMQNQTKTQSKTYSVSYSPLKYHRINAKIVLKIQFHHEKRKRGLHNVPSPILNWLYTLQFLCRKRHSPTIFFVSRRCLVYCLRTVRVEFSNISNNVLRQRWDSLKFVRAGPKPAFSWAGPRAGFWPDILLEFSKKAGSRPGSKFLHYIKDKDGEGRL